MKEFNKKSDFSDREWEEIAAALSGETDGTSEVFARFLAEDSTGTAVNWKATGSGENIPDIDIDKAWDRLDMKIKTTLAETSAPAATHIRPFRTLIMRVAAAVAILAALGSLTIYISRISKVDGRTEYTTASDEKKTDLLLPDGSKVSLNRNSMLALNADFGDTERRVELSGEAYFEITPDASKPFIISTGKATVEVVGTTFNVISNNIDSEVEVFVTSGKVMLTDNSGNTSIMLDPGYIGKITGGAPVKDTNSNPNYLSWYTGHLEYNGQRLEAVFHDLKRAYDMNITTDDPSVLDYTWTTAPIDNQPEETIINLICLSFNLSYTFEGNTYKLTKK